LRWQQAVDGLEPTQDGLLISIATPQGNYRLLAAWLIATDGARSTTRRQLGLASTAARSTIRSCSAISGCRWRGRPSAGSGSIPLSIAALLHKQADDVWRLDLKVGASTDRD